jgi:hypothetical protein
MPGALRMLHALPPFPKALNYVTVDGSKLILQPVDPSDNCPHYVPIHLRSATVQTVILTPQNTAQLFT